MTTRTQHRIRIAILLLIIAVLAPLLGRHIPTPGIDLPALYERLGIDRATPQQAPTFSVFTGPHPWLEVYVDGVLTSEWQPRDGDTYRVLLDMIEQQQGDALMLARACGRIINAARGREV